MTVISEQRVILKLTYLTLSLLVVTKKEFLLVILIYIIMQKGDKKKEKYRVGEIVWIKTKFLQLKFLTQIVWRIDIQIIGD